MADLEGTQQLLSRLSPVQSYGKVTKVVGLVAEGRGIKAPLGSVCQLLPDAREDHVINAEVVGFKDDILQYTLAKRRLGRRAGQLTRKDIRMQFRSVSTVSSITSREEAITFSSGSSGCLILSRKTRSRMGFT